MLAEFGGKVITKKIDLTAIIFVKNGMYSHFPRR